MSAEDLIAKDAERSQAAAQRLNVSFDAFAQEFVDYVDKEFNFPKKAVARLEHLLKYTCPGGKLNRGVLAILTVEDITEHNAKLGNESFKPPSERQTDVLGWCIEILQACFLVADDIMDRAETRRGHPCWYKQKDVQMDAVNDALILESFLFYLLKVYFAPSPDSRGEERLRELETYTALTELYRDVSLRTQLGQMLDLLSQPQMRKDPELLDNFTLEVYQNIIKYKTAFYTFYLPIASGMIACGIDGQEALDGAKAISEELGDKFQIQDDYLDCFGDEVVIGKKGTDILDHKCTWLVVQALQRVTPEQRKILETCYGSEDEAKQEQVKQLYRDLGLPELYEEQEEASYKRVLDMIEKHSEQLPFQVFNTILNRIHKRDH